MNELISQLQDLQSQVERAWLSLDLDRRSQDLVSKQALMQTEDFWQDRKKAETISREIAREEEQILNWQNLRHNLADLLVLARTGQDSEQGDWQNELNISFEQLRAQYQELAKQLMLSGPYAGQPAIISIYAGAGGVDAQDWAQMLERMYLRLAEKQGWQTVILDRMPGQQAGIKYVTMKLTGENAFGYLQAEKGVHRLVRLSPFDADHQRHTSFAMVEVLPELEQVTDIVIDEKDLRIDVFRASGHGGQSVNTTDSAVRLTHLPTGITAVCQNERSQMQNKEQARKYLLGKLEQYYHAEKEEERQRLRGEFTENAWGSQIRSYVIHPYKMVKDHRTKFESKDPDSVLDGTVMPFIEAHLSQQAGVS